MASPQWICWQLVDTSFPAGGFAHSGGLEAAHQAGIVPDEQALAAFARDAVTQAAKQALPHAMAVFRHPDQLADVDLATDAVLTNHVAHRTSRTMGRALLHAADQIYPHAELRMCINAVREGATPGHLAPVFGLVTHTLDLPEPDARLLFLYQQLRAVVSAAVRLGIVGPTRGQVIQHQLAEHTQLLADATDDAETWQTMPVADILQAGQDRLYSRLFQS